MDDYLQSQGYFTRHNIRYRPDPDEKGYDKERDSNYSDIDILAVHPRRKRNSRVMVVNCKSWQSGFNASHLHRALENGGEIGGRPAWKSFRELVEPRWSRAFLCEVERSTGSRSFTYALAVTRLKGDSRLWTDDSSFSQALDGNPIVFLPLCDMLQKIREGIGTTPAGSEIGRVLQLMKASDLK